MSIAIQVGVPPEPPLDAAIRLASSARTSSPSIVRLPVTVVLRPRRSLASRKQATYWLLLVPHSSPVFGPNEHEVEEETRVEEEKVAKIDVGLQVRTTKK